MSDYHVRMNASGFREVLKSPGVCAVLGQLASAASMRAEAASGIHYGHGVDNDARRAVSARGWVGTSANPKWGKKRSERYLERAADGLSQALR